MWMVQHTGERERERKGEEGGEGREREKGGKRIDFRYRKARS